jgi:TorA maturation chaperone TorD
VTLLRTASVDAPPQALGAWLLARWWSRPLPEAVAEWEAAWPLAREGAEALGAPVADVESALDAASADELLEEYERLLIGPGKAPCPPYESLWRADQPRRERGILMSSASADVLRIFGDIGLAVRHDAHELPDHVAVEWEALAYALERDMRTAAGELAQHLSMWMSPFCDAVAAETTQPFYEALARLTPVWTATLAR